jgi:hypothetical protein
MLVNSAPAAPYRLKAAVFYPARGVGSFRSTIHRRRTSAKRPGCGSDLYELAAFLPLRHPESLICDIGYFSGDRLCWLVPFMGRTGQILVAAAVIVVALWVVVRRYELGTVGRDARPKRLLSSRQA